MLRVLCLFVACAPGVLHADDQAAPVPHWIWPTRERLADQQVTMRSSIEVERVIQQAQLRCAADFCRVRVVINGRPVLVIEDYAPWVDEDVTAHLRRGRNVVELQCTGSTGPSAVAFSLHLVADDGHWQVLLSDSSWSAPAEDKPGQLAAEQRQVTSFGAVASRLWGVDAQPVAISALDDYEQWREALGTSDGADPATFVLPEEFEIERVRTAQEDEGSWVSLTFDPHGRLLIAREDKGIIRLKLSPSGSHVESVETINGQLEECRGLLFAHNALYVNANNSKGLHRLRDTGGNDQFDDIQQLRSFPGGVGHGRNDLARDDEGRIYSIHGDAVDVPEQDIFDRRSPYAHRPHDKSLGEGYLVRTDPDGQSWELLCGGLRNPFGIAIHPQHQECFTYDADAEHDMGAPWYRPTRIVHLVSGADYGWRNVTGSWPPYYPDHADNALPVADIGKGSPTAVEFGHQSHFPPRFRDALFVLDWAYGRVIAVHLVARGASYMARSEVFLRGRPLNVTDLAFGPDGAMYLTTGGRQTQSALYRVRYVGSQSMESLPSEQQLARDEFSRAARCVRRELEAHHGVVTSTAIDDAWSHLNHPDPALRYAARLALEHQPLAGWQPRALNERPAMALTALLALARAAEEDLLPVIINRLDQVNLAELPPWQQLTALQAYAICLARHEPRPPRPPTASNARLIERLEAVLARPRCKTIHPAGMGRPVEQNVAELLLTLNAPHAVEQTMALLDNEASQEGRLHYLFLLRHQRNGWTPRLREAYFTALRQTSQFTGGRGMPDFLDTIRKEAIAALTPDERERLGPLLDPQPEPDPYIPSRTFVRQWQREDLAALLTEVGRGRNYEQGRQAFREALCSGCHRVGSEGDYLHGPDLTSLGQRFSREDILEAILSPSSVVAEPFQNMEIITKDGRVLVGRVITSGDYRSSLLRLATDPLQTSQVVEIAKSEIEESRKSKVSPMPAGLLNTLSREEVLDLLAFLESAGDPQHPAFRR